MRASTPMRWAAVAAAVALLGAAGCRRAAEEEPIPPPPTPLPTPEVESAGEFQAVATVERAFIDIGPEIDLPDTTPLPRFEDEETPAPRVEGRVTPTVGGVARIELEAISDELRDRCGADVGQRHHLFWTTRTEFDQVLVTANMEETLDGRRIGLIGTIFLRPGLAPPRSPGELEPGEPATPTPAVGATPTPATVQDTRCVLVAEQVGTSTGALPTPRPTPARTPARTPTAQPITPTVNQP